MIKATRMTNQTEQLLARDRDVTPHSAHAETQQEIDSLRAGLESRAQIGIAIGLIMARCELTSTEAFGHLSRMSQNQNIKVRDIAARMVAESDASAAKPVR